MNRFTHPVEQEEVMAWLDGELPAERAADLASHLEQCAECRALEAELRAVSQRLAAWQVEPSSLRLGEQVTAALNQHAAKQRVMEPARRRPLIRSWMWTAAGALAVFLVIVSIAIPNLLRSRQAVDEASRYAAERARMAELQDKEQAAPGRSFSMKPPGGKAILREIPREVGIEQAAPGRSFSMKQLAPPQVVLRGRVQAALDQLARPMIIRTAAMTLLTKEFDNARAGIEHIVRQHQGYIAQLSTTGSSGAARSLSGTLRLPADRLDSALAELKKLGRVEQETQGGEEITQQYVDLVARLSNARHTEQRLIEVLRERTGKVADILAVEKEIARVREEIERMDAQRKSLENQVSFATVQLQLKEEYRAQLAVAPPSTATRLWNELVQGCRAATESAVGLLAFILGYGPVLLFWFLVLFFPARFAWRRLKSS